MQWLKRLFSRRRRYDDLSISNQEHFEEKTEELLEAGLSPEDAQRTARREFGNLALIEERSREVYSSWRVSVGHRINDVIHTDLRTEGGVLDRIARVVQELP
jgi:hypothetical protein